MINQPENRRRIYEAFSAGLNSSEIVAYHGTSIQALKRVMETGWQDSDDVRGRKNFPYHYRIGDIFVYPIDGRAVLPFRMEMFTDEKAQEEAGKYAQDIARDHWLGENLGIDPFQARNDLFSGELIDDGDINFLRRVALAATGREYSWTEACRLYEKIKTKYGLVVGYSQKILDDGEPLQVREGEGPEKHAVRVKNVDISSLVGIEPLDQESYDYFSSLEAELQCMAD